MGGVQRAKHNMCGHRHRQVRQRLEGGKIGPIELIPACIHRRQPKMAVRCGPAMAGNVLEDRQHAALLQSLGNGAGDRSDLARLSSIGPVANNRVGSGNRHVRQRQAIDGDSEVDQVGCDQP